MDRDLTISSLESTTVEDMPELFVMSYNRGGRVITLDKVVNDFSDEALEHVHLVVREEQAEDYREKNSELISHGMHLLEIPAGRVTGVGSTRNFVMDYAYSIGADVAFNFDDDITALNVLWEGYHPKTGEKGSRCMCAADQKAFPHYHQRIVQLVAKNVREMFAEYPNLAVGNVRKQRFSNTAFNAETRYRINKGGTPRQTNIYNVKLLGDNNLRTPMQFDKHGDDIGFAAYLVENGYSLFNLPWVAYSYVPETSSSTLRDADEEKNRGIHEEEYKNLMNMEIKNYLRMTKKYEDGSYMYGDINWQRLHKLRGTEPIVVGW